MAIFQSLDYINIYISVVQLDAGRLGERTRPFSRYGPPYVILTRNGRSALIPSHFVWSWLSPRRHGTHDPQRMPTTIQLPGQIPSDGHISP
jgi:hypothetical protein